MLCGGAKPVAAVAMIPCSSVGRLQELAHVAVHRVGLVDAQQALGAPREAAQLELAVDDEERFALARSEVRAGGDDDAQAAERAHARPGSHRSRRRLAAVAAEADERGGFGGRIWDELQERADGAQAGSS
jgi:hypothetical protein